MKRFNVSVGLIALCTTMWNCRANVEAESKSARYDYKFPIPFAPRQYSIAYAALPPVIDGLAKDEVWARARWSENFVDIEGEHRPAAEKGTRMKMAYDDRFLYVFGEMEEDHVWAKLHKRDTVVYYDDDFEIFIDPDGDGHYYTEIEVNALNTVWDLMLVHPYRVGDADKVLWKWNIADLQTAVHIEGSLNNPDDIDSSWSVEMAIPLAALNEFAGKKKAGPGVVWRINFSRVDWEVDVADGQYVKRTDEAGKSVPERNWVWSPQGHVAMHMPEMWGYARFEDKRPESNSVVGGPTKPNSSDLVVAKEGGTFEGGRQGQSKAASSGGGNWEIGADEFQKMELWRLHFQLAEYYKAHKMYPTHLEGFTYDRAKTCGHEVKLESTTHMYELVCASCESPGTHLVLNHEGRVMRRID